MGRNSLYSPHHVIGEEKDRKKWGRGMRYHGFVLFHRLGERLMRIAGGGQRKPFFNLLSDGGGGTNDDC